MAFTFTRSKNLLSLDVGTGFIKLAEVKPTGRGVEIIKYAVEPVPPEEEMSRDDFEITGLPQALKKIIQTNKIKATDVISYVPNEASFIKYLQMPLTPEKELPQVIEWEIAKSSNFSSADSIIAFKTQREFIDEKKLKKTEIFVAAAKKAFVNKHIWSVGRAGLNLAGLIPKPVAYAALFQAHLPADPQQTVAFFDLGHTFTGITIFMGNLDCFFREINVGGKDLTRAISEELDVTLAQAEELKQKYGLPGYAQDGNLIEPTDDEFKEVVIAMRPVLERLVSETERTFAYFHRQAPEASLNKILITGGTANLKNIGLFLKENLELPVEPLNLLKYFGSSPIANTLTPSRFSGAALAFGLTQPDSLDRINLLPTKTQRFKEKIKTTVIEKGVWRLVLPVLVPVLLLSYLGLSFSINKYQRRVNETGDFLQRLEIQWPGLEKLSQEKDNMLRRVEILETLTGQQLPWENLFREFSNLSIPDRLWLTNLVCSKQTTPPAYTVQLTGYGLSQSDVTDFAIKLSKSPYLNKVTMGSSIKTSVPNITPPEAIRFTIATQVNLNYLKSQLKKEQ